MCYRRGWILRRWSSCDVTSNADIDAHTANVRADLTSHLRNRDERVGGDSRTEHLLQAYKLRRKANSSRFSSWLSANPNVCPGTARFVTPGGFQPFGS